MEELTYTPKNVVAIAGVETIRNKEGKVLKYSDTFLDNMLTWKHEHPKDNIVILDARKYIKCENPIEAIWQDVVKSFEQLDELIYAGHSSTESLICFSHVRLDLNLEQRYFRSNFHYNVPWSKDASFSIFGCQAGGMNKKKMLDSIAQIISNKIERTVYAFVSKSYQKEDPKGHYRQVSDDKIGLVKFTPIKKISEVSA